MKCYHLYTRRNRYFASKANIISTWHSIRRTSLRIRVFADARIYGGESLYPVLFSARQMVSNFLKRLQITLRLRICRRVAGFSEGLLSDLLIYLRVTLNILSQICSRIIPSRLVEPQKIKRAPLRSSRGCRSDSRGESPLANRKPNI